MADLDNDGDLDIISSMSETGLAIHENLGGGQFNSPISIYTSASNIFTTDIDGDGDLDLYVCNYSPLTPLFKNCKTNRPFYEQTNRFERSQRVFAIHPLRVAGSGDRRIPFRVRQWRYQRHRRWT